ncbi:MAG: hypothetical protein M3317_03560 [Actinomycetota bacterium]|nr:hypothetical protein [Actinomycetota bacterium]
MTKVLLCLVVAAQVALVTSGLVLEALAGPAFSLLDAAGSAASILTFPAVGLFILSRRPGHPIGWIFCLANLGWAVNNCAGSYARYALVSSPGTLPAGGLAVWLYTWPGSISVALFVFLGLLFPDGTLLSRRWRYVAWSVVVWSVIAVLASAFAPGPVDDTIGFRADNPLGIVGPTGKVLEPIAGLTQLLAIPLFAVAALCLILRQLRATGQERLQLKWFTSSVALVVAMYVVQAAIFVRYGSPAAFPDWARFYYALSIRSDVLIPIAAGFAILRHRLYDIDVIINRTLVYGLLSVTLVALYFGGIVLLQRLFVLLTGQQSTLAVVASTLAIAALFNPLRRRIQGFVDRRFYRRKYDAGKTLEAFSAKLRDATDLESLSGDLKAVVGETMQPAHVSLWLRPDPAPRRSGEQE